MSLYLLSGTPTFTNRAKVTLCPFSVSLPLGDCYGQGCIAVPWLLLLKMGPGTLMRPDFHAPSLWSWEDTSVASVSILETFLAFFFFFSSSIPHLQLIVCGSLCSVLHYTSDCCFLPYTSSKQTSDCQHSERTQPSAPDFEDLEMVTYFLVPDHLQTMMPLLAHFQAMSLILER